MESVVFNPVPSTSEFADSGEIEEGAEGVKKSSIEAFSTDTRSGVRAE
jgi:hypothetical protein